MSKTFSLAVLAIMTNSVQARGWLSRMRTREACAALMLAIVVVTQSAQAQTFSVLYAFKGTLTDGCDPLGAVVMDKQHDLYGTTEQCGSSSDGTAWELSSGGIETLLYNFTGSDGATPRAGLILDATGNLYGTTYDGGSASYGTVYRLGSGGGETVLHSFTGGSSDGEHSFGGLIRDASGNLYGTTVQGGSTYCGGYGCGIVFELSSSGTLTVLHTFTGSDGAYPAYGSLLMDTKGNLYGVTPAGGDLNNCPKKNGFGCGVVYKLSKSGKFRLLHIFTGGSKDGCPYGTLVTDANGSLYGTTSGCGSSGSGTVFKLTKDGTETVLHNFVGGGSDGLSPVAGVVRDKNGNLYGTTEIGGTLDNGTVYKLSASGKLTLLHSFNGGSDGANPMGGLIRDAKGHLYGTANLGGSYGYGTVFEVTP
ncbi:MAG: choice-of-anchor tandem repeat GloVer-containing protein [Terriglobales bacterium]